MWTLGKHYYDVTGIGWKFDMSNFHSTCILGFSMSTDCPRLDFELWLDPPPPPPPTPQFFLLRQSGSFGLNKKLYSVRRPLCHIDDLPWKVAKNASLSCFRSKMYDSGKNSSIRRPLLLRCPRVLSQTLSYSRSVLKRPVLVARIPLLGIRFTSCSPDKKGRTHKWYAYIAR